MVSAREEYEHLLQRSREFYETAVMQLERELYGLASFSLEQSLQLFLKAVLLKLGVDYPRTHSVRRLLKLIAEAYPPASGVVDGVLKKYSLELAALEDVYITSRYVPRVFSREEVERLRNVVDEVRKAVSEAVG